MFTLDDIIVLELMEIHQLSMILDKDGEGKYIEPDWKLLEAIERVLKCYMTCERYESWIQSVALDKLSLVGQLNGEYGEPRHP